MNPGTFSVMIGDEVYVYILGRLVYKRWMKTGQSATFHINPSGVRYSS